MSYRNGRCSENENHVRALRKKHALLSSKIETELQHLSSSDAYIKKLKIQKLHIKEELEGLCMAA